MRLKLSLKKNKETPESEPESELETLEKLGVVMDALEKKAKEAQIQELESQKDTIIEKAEKQKTKENILEIKEISDNLETITKELVSTFFIPIDLFVNIGFQDKGITPITELEIQKLFELIMKMLPKESLEKLTETAKKTKKLDWFKNLDKSIALIRHLLKMSYTRIKQFKTWKALQEAKVVVD